MSGYVTCMGTCYGCGAVFAFNPLRVPSVRVDGVREPVCLSCVTAANPLRQANGLDPIVVHEDAYSGCREEEVPWDGE